MVTGLAAAAARLRLPIEIADIFRFLLGLGRRLA
jgi:hypothetical protein